MKSKFRIVQVIALLVLLSVGCQPETTSDIKPETNIRTEEETAACKQIVFSYAIHGRNGFDENIVSICPDGTEKRRLTVDSEGNLAPTWSPDGSKIAFLSGQSGTGQLYVMDPDGGNIRQITFGPEGAGKFFWLPDGNRIAVMRIELDREKNWQDRERSWQAVDVTTNNIVPLPGWNDEVFFDSPIFSHDGTRLVYLARSENGEQIAGYGSPSLNQIRIRNIDGSNDYALTDDNWANSRIAWSPDDSQIAFIAFTSEWDGTDDHFAIYMVNVDGSNLHRVVDGSDLPRIIELEFSKRVFFTWSPDGESFAIFAHGSFYILDLKSGEATVLFSIEEPNYITSLSWQP